VPWRRGIMKKGRGVSGRALFARHAITTAPGERVGQRHWRRPPRPKFTHKEDTMDEHSHESQEDQTAVAVVAEPRDPTYGHPSYRKFSGVRGWRAKQLLTVALDFSLDARYLKLNK
jgi:hypothetical protein